MEGETVSSELINACIRQERKAQNALYKLLYSRMMNICRRYSNEEEQAREFFIQGFLKILNKLEKFPVHIPFESWASKVMINAIIDDWRKQKRFKDHHEFLETKDLEFESEREMNEFEKKISHEEALNMLRTLPDSTRQVFALFAIDEYTHKEIGELLGISANTSKWHVAEARKKLLESVYKAAKTIIV